jgi:DNA-directed RNA polymerase subunit RPC12/RpoP
MTIDFTCAKCEGSFELDSADLMDGSEKLVCPHCEAKATQAQTDDLIAAFTELTAQVAALSKKFAMSITVETDDVEVVKKDDDDEEEDDDDDDDDDDEDDDDDDDEDEEDLDEEV